MQYGISSDAGVKPLSGGYTLKLTSFNLIDYRLMLI